MGVINKKYASLLKEFSKQDWELLINNIDLSDEELQIIDYIRRGWRQIDIAENFSVHENTIKRKYKNIAIKIAVYIGLEDLPFSNKFLKLFKVIK
ncbi:MAG: hypothetical protein K2L15_03825 [Eubacteriales bacterium]|nr:hypothetical protein [Eubacteriales bacterium]